MTVHFSDDHLPYDFSFWKNISHMQKCCKSFFVENLILYKMVKQHLDCINSTPYINLGSKFLERKISISCWQSALYKISSSIYIYFFKYLYRNVVWNIKTNQFNIIVCDLLHLSVGESTVTSNFTWKSLHAWSVVCVAFLRMTVLCCFAFMTFNGSIHHTFKLNY